MTVLLEIETIRIVRGKAAKGIQKNPSKPKDGTGRRRQARSDRTVDQEYEDFWAKVDEGYDPWETGKPWDDRAAAETAVLGNQKDKGQEDKKIKTPGVCLHLR